MRSPACRSGARRTRRARERRARRPPRGSRRTGTKRERRDDERGDPDEERGAAARAAAPERAGDERRGDGAEQRRRATAPAKRRSSRFDQRDPQSSADRQAAERDVREPVAHAREQAREQDAGRDAEAQRDADRVPGRPRRECTGRSRSAPYRRGPLGRRIAVYYVGRPAADRSRSMTARPNSAARAPSTTRWSNVTETLPIWRTTTSPSRTTGASAIRWTPRIATSGWLTSGVDEEAAELAGARDGERRAAQLLRRERARARRRRRAVAPRRRARRRSARRSRARPGRRAPRRSARRRRGRSGRGRRSRRPRGARSARGTPAATPAAAFSTSGTSSSRSTPVKSHSSTQVTAGISRCARVRCSTISAADAAQRLAPALVVGAVAGAGRGAHVVLGDPPPRAGAVDAREVDAELLRDPADERRRADAPRGRRHDRDDRLRRRGLRLRPSSTARRSCSPASPITTSTVPTGDDVALARRGSRATVPAAGDGISTVVLSVCDLDERVVLGDLLALGDEPAGDLALGQALAEVGQLELVRHGAEGTSRRRRPGARASTTRSTDGMYQSSSCQYGYGTS